jgi:hypothetical protein
MVIPVLLFYLLNFYKEKYCFNNYSYFKSLYGDIWNAFEDDKMLLENFGIPIVNEYGASELI